MSCSAGVGSVFGRAIDCVFVSREFVAEPSFELDAVGDGRDADVEFDADFENVLVGVGGLVREPVVVLVAVLVFFDADSDSVRVSLSTADGEEDLVLSEIVEEMSTVPVSVCVPALRERSADAELDSLATAETDCETEKEMSGEMESVAVMLSVPRVRDFDGVEPLMERTCETGETIWYFSSSQQTYGS